MYEIFYLEGEVPAKKNSRINLKCGRSIPSKRYTEWHKYALEQLAIQWKGVAPLEGPVKVRIRFCHRDLRRRDSDNGTSSILDALTDAGILKDDNWQVVQDLEVFNGYEKGRAWCTIEILSAKREDPLQGFSVSK